MYKYVFFVILSIILFGSCWNPIDSVEWVVTNVEGYKPIYLETNVSRNISKEPPKDIINGGVIFSYGDLLLVNDLGTGIHVIDNSDVTNPTFLYFISIPGNYDMSLKDDLLYVDNFNDLVTIRLTIDDIEIVNRVTGVIEVDNHPRQQGFYFECVDQTKGQVIGWEATTLEEPKCFR